MSELERLKPGINIQAMRAEDVCFPEIKQALEDRKRRVNDLIKEGKFTVSSGGVVVVNEAIEESPLLFDIVMTDRFRDIID